MATTDEPLRVPGHGSTMVEGWHDNMRLRIMAREPHGKPCGDCGREHLNGEHVQWYVPTAEPNGRRLVWEGCIDCYVRRTDPNRTPEGTTP